LLSGFDLPFAGEKVILSIPPSMVHSRQISLPISDRRRLREILPLELSGDMAVQSEEMSFDALPLDGDSHLAAWCRGSEVAPIIAELLAAGAEPEIVTCSAFHWNYLLPEGVENPCVVTDGNGLMFGISARPFLARGLSPLQGDKEFNRTVAAFEISRDISVSGVLRIGADAGESSLPLNAGLLDTFGGDKGAATDIAGAYAVAKACVLGSVLNFRSGVLAYTAGQAKNIRRLRLTAILAASLVLLLFVEIGIRYFMVRRDISSLELSIGSIYREVFPARKKPQDAVGEVKSEIRRLNGGASAQRVLPTLKKLSELKGEEVTGFYETEIEGEKIHLKGDAKSVNDFKNRASKALATAEISEIKSKSDGTVSFVFRGTMKGGN
jgi:general secretion pathway protein L